MKVRVERLLDRMRRRRGRRTVVERELQAWYDRVVTETGERPATIHAPVAHVRGWRRGRRAAMRIRDARLLPSPHVHTYAVAVSHKGAVLGITYLGPVEGGHGPEALQ